VRTNSRSESYCVSKDGAAEALYFAAGSQRLFGWIHKPLSGTPARFGLVICKPFGREEVCAHRYLRAVAKAAAAANVPTMIFDYVSTGDSPDIDPLSNQLDAWTDNVLAAVGELQQRTGVTNVGLLGCRFGALLAVRAARGCKAVTALVLVAPIISGRRYLRELQMVRVASVSAASADSDKAPSQSHEEGIGPLEVGGYSLSTATVAALAEIDLAKLGVAPAADLVVIDDSTAPRARAWTESISARGGGRTQYLFHPGVAEMFLTLPTFAEFRQEMIGAMGEWLPSLRDRHSESPSADVPQDVDVGSPAAISELKLLDPTGGDAALTERPVYLDAKAAQPFGIVTEPPRNERRRRAIILLNSGADNHVGPNRLYVSFARTWARRGYTTLRMDLAGLGDSDTRPGQLDNDVFASAALDDVRSAIDFLRARYDIEDISLGGICSGAYHALRAAVAGLSVNRVLMINPMNFFWTDLTRAEDRQRFVDVVRGVEFYRRHALSSTTWKNLLAGRLKVWRVARVLVARPLMALESTLRDWAWRLHIRLPRDLRSELEQIVARDVRVIFIFARGEPGLDVLRVQGGSSVTRLGERCSIHIIDKADHTFTDRSARAALENCLNDELSVRTRWGNLQFAR
jgi:dienelactone hydrolase